MNLSTGKGALGQSYRGLQAFRAIQQMLKSEAVQLACDRGVRQLAAQEQVVAQAGLE